MLLFKFKKLFICSLLSLLLISSSVFATDTNQFDNTIMPRTTSSSDVMPISEAVPTSDVESISEESTVTSLTKPETTTNDLSIFTEDSHTITGSVDGNVFAFATKLTIDSKNNGGQIYGNVYAMADEIIIESDATYSDNKDKMDNYMINTVNSKCVIDGSIYAFAETFTLEAGTEVNGDLYVIATNINIEPNCVIHGNLFVFSDNVKLNGQVGQSAYINAMNFDMGLYTYIARDLYLDAQTATLDGIVYRNASITVSGDLTTLSDFKTYQNITVKNAKNFNFSGEVMGNADLNIETLNFVTSDTTKCIIQGNLNYAIKNSTDIPEGIVTGTVTSSDYVDTYSNKFDITGILFSLLAFLVYVFVLAVLVKKLTPKCVEKLQKITVRNILVSLGIGFASIFAIFILFFLLCFTGLGITLAFVLLVAYLFLLALAVPLLLLSIANNLKFKLNLYQKLLIISAILYLVSLIPFIGSGIMFIAVLIGIGRIILNAFNNKN